MPLRAALLAVLISTAAAAEESTELPVKLGAGGLEEPAVTERALVDDDYQVRLSLPTEDDFEAWAKPGFQLQLGYAYGSFSGKSPEAPFNAHSVTLRPSVRIDRHWSLAGSFAYAVALGDLEGIRFGATLETVFHPLRALGLAVGLGYGGLVGDRPPTSSPEGEFFNAGQESVGRTLVGGEKMFGCEGGGLVALARVEYLFVVGPLFATGPYLAADVQRTRCEESRGTDPETGEPVAFVQWWLQGAWSAGWWLAWR